MFDPLVLENETLVGKLEPGSLVAFERTIAHKSSQLFVLLTSRTELYCCWSKEIILRVCKAKKQSKLCTTVAGKFAGRSNLDDEITEIFGQQQKGLSFRWRCCLKGMRKKEDLNMDAADVRQCRV